MKLLNWKFQYWHFNKYFVLYTSTSVTNLFALSVMNKCEVSLNESLIKFKLLH